MLFMHKNEGWNAHGIRDIAKLLILVESFVFLTQSKQMSLTE